MHKPDPRPMPEVISGIGAPALLAPKNPDMLALKRPMRAAPKVASGSVDEPKFDASMLLG